MPRTMITGLKPDNSFAAMSTGKYRLEEMRQRMRNQKNFQDLFKLGQGVATDPH
jgi:hypothetical protein